MNIDLYRLGARWFNCHSFSWMPGLRAVWPQEMDCLTRMYARDEGIVRYHFKRGKPKRTINWHRGDIREPEPDHGAVPDVTDPASIGCLLAMVRKAYGNPLITTTTRPTTQPTWWVVVDERGIRFSGGDTEAEALIIALERAPEPVGGEE